MSARIRTGFSFRTAVGAVDEVISRLVEIGATTAPITDRASMFGFVKWTKAAKKAGLRPIYGVELGVSPSIEAKKPLVDHFTFLAKNSLRPVNELMGTATRQFRYEPLLQYNQVMAATDVIRIAGHRADLTLLTPQDGLYVGASPSASMPYLRAALAAGHPLIAMGDNMYPRKSDHGFYQVLVGRGASTQTYPQHILSDDEWMEEMLDKGEDEFFWQGIRATRDRVLGESVATLAKGTMLIPAKPLSLREICEQAAPGLNIDLGNEVYAARLDRELDLIAEKGYEDYFFIVGDLVRWARERMTVGPARGSSSGSLVCYLLGITKIDPIPFGLIFERFIDINRGGWRYKKDWKGFADAPRTN